MLVRRIIVYTVETLSTSNLNCSEWSWTSERHLSLYTVIFCLNHHINVLNSSELVEWLHNTYITNSAITIETNKKLCWKQLWPSEPCLGGFVFRAGQNITVCMYSIYDCDRAFQKQISFRSPLQWLAIVYLTQCSTFNKFSSRRESQLVSYLLNLSRLLPRFFTQDDGCCLTGICLVTADYLRH